MKNILIISIYYPPIQSIASNRIYSFAKYLNRDKYRVFVHTLDQGGIDQDTLTDVSVTRSKNKILFKPATFLHKSNQIVHYSKVIYNKILNRLSKNIYDPWIEESFELLKLKIEEENIQIMLSSFSPDATHILALRLKKEFPNLKWIADMRDEMSANPFIDPKTKKKYQVLEQQILQYAHAITSVSKPIIDAYKEMAQEENLRFCEIRNGYDFMIERMHIKNKIFTIKYIGNFYGERNPNNFLLACKEWMKENNIHDFMVQFIGVKTHFNVPEALNNKILTQKVITHVDAVQEMKKSDALLLIHPNNGRKGVFTGKIFEYLASLRPIIALVDPEDVAAKLIQKCNAGYVSDFNDIEQIKKIIMQAYTAWKQNDVKKINIEEIKKHHRKQQVKRLEKLIDEIAAV